MKRPTDLEIRYVMKALKLGLKDNEKYPHVRIHLKTCTTMEIELLNWILGEGDCPYPLSEEIVKLSELKEEKAI